MNSPEPRRSLELRRKGVYLLPNGVTTASLFAAFYAIVQAMNGEFETAAISIFVSMVLDGMDGRIARWTHTQSSFGEQYDSLADMVAFGAAPALIMYEWILKDLGRWGWFAAFVYVAGAALRLARFNANIGVVDKRYFQGLPPPAAAALVAGTIWLADDLQLPTDNLAVIWSAWAITLYAGVTMISNVPFYSFKDLGRHKRVPIIVIFLLGIGMFVLSAYPPTVLFGLFIAYGLSGYIVWAWRMRKGQTTADVLKKSAAPVAPATTDASNEP